MDRPPFRADQVGSLLRPEDRWRGLRARFKRGEVDAQHAACRRRPRGARSRAAAAVDLGLQAVTDGEFRRDWWHLDFLSQLDGVTLKHNEGEKVQDRRPERAAADPDRDRSHRLLAADHGGGLRLLKSVTAADGRR